MVICKIGEVGEVVRGMDEFYLFNFTLACNVVADRVDEEGKVVREEILGNY